MDRRFGLVLACFFASGLSGLIYQVVWSEQLMLLLGASHAAVATVLAAFMAGLALGAELAGRYGHRLRRPLLAYGLLEAAIACSALAIPTLLHAAERLESSWLSSGMATSGGGASLLFFIGVAFALLLFPTAAMGATLPLLARGEIHHNSQLASRLGLLYGGNTLGAAAGAAASAFVLVPTLGVPHTVLVAVALNLLVFVLAWRIERSRPPESIEVRPDQDAEPARPAGRILWLLPLMLLSGAVSFFYEVLWTRLLSHLLGSSIFAFGTMLSLFLGGLALGSGLVGLPILRRRDPVAVLAALQLLIALLGAAMFAGADRLPSLAGNLGLGRLGNFLLAAFVLLPLTTAIGATWPLAVRAFAGTARRAGRAAGEISAFNTLGAIVGALAGGLLLLPALGFAGSVRVAVATSLGLALMAWLLRPHSRRSQAALAALLPLVFLLPLREPMDLLRLEPNAPGTEDSERPELRSRGKVVFEAVGRSSDVLLLDQGMTWRLTTNGLPESLIYKKGARMALLPVARWLVHLPAVLRPEAKDALVVGYGGGALLEDLPSAWRHVDVIEIEAEVLAANQRIADARRRDPMADPRLHIVLDDARSVLRRSSRRWDVIVSQPSHPWTSASSHLFTREFFDLAAARLSDDGIFVAWMGNAYVDRRLTLILLRTLAESFPAVALYQPPGAGTLLLVGSRQRLGTTSNASLEADAGLWARLGVSEVSQFEVALRLDDAGVRALSAQSPINTDAVNLLKTGSPQIRGGLSIAELGELTAGVDPLPRTVRQPLVALRRLLDLGQKERAEHLLAAMPPGEDAEVAKALLLAARGERGKAILLLRSLPSTPTTRGELVALFRQELQRGDEASLLEETRDPERAVAEGWRLEAGQLAALESRLEAIPAGHPLAADALRLRIRSRLAGGSPEEAQEALALTELLLAGSKQPTDFLLRLEAAQVLDQRWIEIATLDELVEGVRTGRIAANLLSRAEPFLANLERMEEQSSTAGLPLAQLLARWRGDARRQ